MEQRAADDQQQPHNTIAQHAATTAAEQNAHAHMHNHMHQHHQQQQQQSHPHSHADLHGSLSVSHDGQSVSGGSEVDAATSAGGSSGGSGSSNAVSLSLSSSPPGMPVTGSRSDGNVSLSSAGLSSPHMSSAASSPASAAVAPSNGNGSTNGGALNHSGASLPIIGSASSVSSGSDDGTILFVGDLSRSVREEELAALFAPFGTLQAIDIKRDRLTQNNLGYGFVQLATRAEATRAKKALHAFELHGRKIRIGLAKKNTTLFIGDLDGSINTAQLVRAFEPFGHIVVEETFVKQPSGKYGFVRFATREDAERAKNEMNHKMLGSRPIRIGWGDSNFEKQCVHVQFEPSAVSLTTGSSVNAVFDDAFFHSTFAPFASACNTTIVNISLPRHNHTKKLKGFAFCHYEENEAGEKAAILALQTLTGQFQQTPVAQHLQSGNNGGPSANGNNANGDAMFGQQQQQQQGQGQGQGNQFDGGSNTPTHLLGGIPVKYSFGKRQIFSRHRRANENAAAAAMGGNGGGVGAGGVGSAHGLGSPLVQSQGAMGLQQMAAMMGQMQSMMGLGGVANGGAGHMQGGGGHGPHHGHGHGGHQGGSHHHGGGHNGGHNGGHGRNHGGGGGGGRYGGHGGGGGNNNRHHNMYNQQSGLGGQPAASMYNNAAAFLPYMQQLQSQQSPQQSPQLHGLHANNRYHTNPQQSFLGVSAHSPLHSHAQTGAPQLQTAPGQQHQHQHQHQHSPVHHDSAGQVSAAAATSWMIQNLAAQQYAQGLAPLSVQQVQQAYQQMQQQQQQQQTPQSHAGVGVGVGTLAGSPYLDLSSASPPAVALDSSDANLASAANAFFNAQSQFYSQQQQQQSQAPSSVGGSHLSLTLSPQQQSLHQPHHHHTLSHPSAHSMAQLMSEMSSLGLGMSAAAQQQQQQAGGPGSPPMHSQQSPQLITSGHSSAATSPTHAANSHALQQFYAQQQQQQQQPFNKILQ